MLQSASDEERTSWGLPLHDSTQQKIFNFLPRVEVSTVESSLSNTREALKSVGINSKQEDKIFKVKESLLTVSVIRKKLKRISNFIFLDEQLHDSARKT